MRPLRYSIDITLDGCCDHRAVFADEDLHRHAAANLNRADALLFGRVTYQMMEAAFRPPAQIEAMPDWMEPFARTINAAKKYVVSRTLDRADWNVVLCSSSFCSPHWSRYSGSFDDSIMPVTEPVYLPLEAACNERAQRWDA